jgi:hypothetical protein
MDKFVKKWQSDSNVASSFLLMFTQQKKIFTFFKLDITTFGLNPGSATWCRREKAQNPR